MNQNFWYRKTTRLLGTVLSTAAMVAIPLSEAKAFDYWDDKIITQDVVYDGQVVGQVRLPDWERISFADFPSVLEGGNISSEFNSYLDYDLSREWFPGDSIVEIIKLGDLAEALAPQEFTVEQISQLLGADPDRIPLSSFVLVGDRTLAELVEAVPALGNLQVNEVVPIAELVKQELGSGYLAQQLDNLIGYSSIASELKLAQLEPEQLASFVLEDIPGLADVPISDFARWENAFISDIPGLADLPLGLMPNPLTNELMPVMRIDAVWSEAENHRYHTISGSYESGFNVPCTAEGAYRCPYIELDDLENLGAGIRLPTEGSQWIAGRDPETGNICPKDPWGVKGGHGILGMVNCGKEPTGRHPFGKLFKVAVWQTDETTDTAQTAIFFRKCVKTLFVDLGCTP